VARRVFFSFEYDNDVTRAMIVRKSAVTQGKETAGFVDAAEFEKIRKKGDQAVRAWINEQLDRTTVTAVLVGSETCDSKWVRYEIEQSEKRGNGLLGIDISKIKDFKGKTTERCGKIPPGYEFYLWFKDDGYNNLGTWIEDAAAAAGK
jgi:Thoeris protein ThsB, TIR-like domain